MKADNEKMNDKIDAFLSGELDHQERLSFEKELAADNDLRLKLQIFRAEYQAKELLIERDLIRKMGQWKKEKKIPPKKRLIHLPHYQMAAALAALVIVLGGIFMFRHSGNSTQLGDSYILDELTGNRRGDLLEYSPALQPGIMAMQAGNYELAAEKFSAVSPDNEYILLATKLKGLCLYQVNQYEQAANAFLEILAATTASTSEYQEAEYLLILTYKKTGNEAYDSLLEKVRNNPQHEYYENVQILK